MTGEAAATRPSPVATGRYLVPIWSRFGPSSGNVPFCRAFLVRMRGLEALPGLPTRLDSLRHSPPNGDTNPRKCGGFSFYGPDIFRRGSTRSDTFRRLRFGPDLVRDRREARPVVSPGSSPPSARRFTTGDLRGKECYCGELPPQCVGRLSASWPLGSSSSSYSQLRRPERTPARRRQRPRPPRPASPAVAPTLDAGSFSTPELSGIGAPSSASSSSLSSGRGYAGTYAGRPVGGDESPAGSGGVTSSSRSPSSLSGSYSAGMPGRPSPSPRASRGSRPMRAMGSISGFSKWARMPGGSTGTGPELSSKPGRPTPTFATPGGIGARGAVGPNEARL